MSATKVAVLLWREHGQGAATFGVFNPTTGADLFTPVEHGKDIGQGTDMKLVGTTHAVITGHKPDIATDTGYSGRLTKVSLADGKLEWSKEYSSCGFKSNAVAGAPASGQCSKGLIYNECWGVAVMADGGFALSCGTGNTTTTPIVLPLLLTTIVLPLLLLLLLLLLPRILMLI